MKRLAEDIDPVTPANPLMDEVKTDVRDPTRRVAIGPVAKQLSNRQSSDSSSWLPFLLYAVAVIGCGYMVYLAAEHASRTVLNQRAPSAAVTQLVDEPETPKRIRPKNSSTSASQVRTVIQLVGAFEDVANEANPLDIPEEDSPTTMVGVYSDIPTKKQTEDFLKMINATGSRELPASEENQPAKITEIIDRFGPSTLLSKTEEAINAVEPLAEDLTEAQTEGMQENTISQSPGVAGPTLMDQLDSNAKATNANTDASLVKAEPSPQPQRIAPLPEDIGSESTTSISGLENVGMSELPVNEPALVASSASAETIEALSTLDEPVAEAPSNDVEQPALRNAEALANYAEALARWQEDKNRVSSRDYYSAAAELASLGLRFPSPEITEALSTIYDAPDQYQLISSAASSWIRWKKRRTDGVLIAGKLETITQHRDGVVLSVATSSKKASIVSVLVAETNIDYSATQNVVVMGAISENSPIDTAAHIHGRLVLAARPGT